MEIFTAYIDEAGDEGFGKLKQPRQIGGQSHWLIMGAMLVRAKNDAKVPTWKRAIREKFPEKRSKDLHWAKLNHDQRVVVSSELSSLPIRAALTLSHKVTIPESKYASTFKTKGVLYNYLVRWLIERLILFCQTRSWPDPAQLRIVFSKRGGTDYESMKDYLRLLRNGQDSIKAPRSTNWDILDIDGIQVEDHSNRAGLQLADCITSAFFTALEPNIYGNFEPSYARRLIHQLMSIGGRTKDCGLTIVPGLHAANCGPEQMDFIRECWCGRTPGP